MTCLIPCADRFNSPACTDLSAGLRLMHLHMQYNACISLHLQLVLSLSDDSAFSSWGECKKFTWVENNAQIIHGRQIPDGLLNAGRALLDV